MRKGKIKFSHTSIDKKIGTKTDYFRVCQDSKNKTGDWENYPGFEPQLRELKFRFPFSKMENNIKIGYSGYCQLSMDGTAKGALGSYFVASNGIGCQLIARPDGHKGVEYGTASGKELLLTPERLSKWKMVKKRMTVFISPDGWGPHEYVGWSTTSEVAMEGVSAEYTQLERLIGTNLAMVPLTLRATTKQFKNREGQSVRFSFGSIGYSGTPMRLKEAVEEANSLKEFFNLSSLEDDFERQSFFFEEEDEAVIPVTEKTNPETGEVTLFNLNGDEIPATSTNEDISDFLRGLVGEAQVRNIVSLAKKLGKESEVLLCSSPAKALALLNNMVSEDNRARKKADQAA